MYLSFDMCALGGAWTARGGGRGMRTMPAVLGDLGRETHVSETKMLGISACSGGSAGLPPGAAAIFTAIVCSFPRFFFLFRSARELRSLPLELENVKSYPM